MTKNIEKKTEILHFKCENFFKCEKDKLKYFRELEEFFRNISKDGYMFTREIFVNSIGDICFRGRKLASLDYFVIDKENIYILSKFKLREMLEKRGQSVED